MDQGSSQESEIMNEGDLEYIMGDLRRAPQFNLFLEGDGCVDEICNPTQENSANSAMLVPNDTQSPTGSLPCLHKYAGVYDFEVELAGAHNSRHAWVYSPKLEKIFIDIDKVLLFQFKLNTPHVKGLRVRALLVYIIPDHTAIPVDRCTLHKFKCDPNHLAHADKKVCLCNNYNQAGHVITTDHPNAAYEFNADSGRHSVLVPLSSPYAGSDSTTVAYQFGCKTSCPGGMARRPVNLIFTLETELGEVVGRCIVPVKICSCPKRDKEREECDEFENIPSYSITKVTKRKYPSAENRSMAKSLKIEMPSTNKAPASTITALFDEVSRVNCRLEKIENQVNDIRKCLQEFSPMLSYFRNYNNDTFNN